MQTGEKPPTDLEQPLMLFSSDSHVGPRLVEDLRAYCPKNT